MARIISELSEFSFFAKAFILQVYDVLARHKPELERQGLVEAIPADQSTVPFAATQAASPVWGAASSGYSTVNQLLKSVVQKICTLRSVGALQRC
jgi:hypothetical protein